MTSILQDAKFGARTFLRRPLMTGCMVLLLALGIGANSAMFSVLDGLLLHPVRYQDPDRLVFVWSHDPQGGLSGVSPADFMDLRMRTKTVGDFAAWVLTTAVVLGGDRPRELSGALVTANFFSTLGVKPVLGRTFLPDEDGVDNPANASHSVVISSRFWRQDLGGDPNVLGRILQVNSISYTIIGVAPPDFQFWWRKHDLWMPISMNKQERDYRDLVVVGRLKGTKAQAVAELNALARELGEAYPKSDQGWTLQVEDLKERLLNGTFRVRLILLSTAVGFVLILACANVASLLLARAAARQREIAVRTSLGATVGRLVQQFLTESAILALSGGALGLVLAWAAIRAAPGFVPPSALPGGSIELSLPVVWFSLGLSVLTCFLVGLAPALGMARASVALKESARGTTAGRGSQRLRQVIVAAEVAVALMLCVSAWLMGSSLRSLSRIDPGFDPSAVLTVRMFLPPAKYDGAQALRFCRQSVERLASLPGVKRATVSTTLPLLNNFEVRFDREGSPRDEAQRPSAPYAAVSPQYFEVLRIPLRRGRFFADADNERAPLVAIVSEELAARFFPAEDPIGKRIEISRPVQFENREEVVKPEIVGVVGNVKDTDLAGTPRPMIYVPHAQNAFRRAVWFSVRTAGTSSGLAGAVRRELMMMDKEQPVQEVGALQDTVASQLAQPRFQAGLMGSFALVALLLAVLGIYGVNAFAVTQRRNEIGVRMALGASRGAVLLLIIRQGMIPTAIGLGVGVAGAVAVASALRSVLVGTDGLDPIAFIGAAAVLTAASLIASFIPAERAARIDPAITLRTE